MRAFWDERADEDAFYFVDNRLSYGAPDAERFWREGEEALRWMFETLGVELPADADVLEIGCGVGRMTRALAATARSVKAVDISSRMLEMAREHNGDLSNVEWVLGDGISLAGVADESVDVCQSAVVFQHIPDPAITLGYITEIGRVLRPGGWAGLMVSNIPEAGWHRKLGLRVRLMQMLRALSGRGPRGQGHPAWLGSAVQIEDVEAAALAGGSAVERVEGAGTAYCLVLQRKAPVTAV